MLSGENNPHEYFEQLCALAVIGELSKEELSKLNAHLTACNSCRSELAAYSDILHSTLALAAPSNRTYTELRLVSGGDLRERFISQAENRGFVFSKITPRRARFWTALQSILPRPPRYAFVLALLLVVGAVGVMSYATLRSTTRSAVLTSEFAEVKRERDALKKQLLESQESPPPEHVGGTEVSADLSRDGSATERPVDTAPNRPLEAELTEALAANAELTARSKAIEDQLQGALVQVEALKLRSENSNGSELEARLKATETNLSELYEEIKNLRDAKSRDQSTIVSQETRMRELAERLRDQAETLDRERKLLAADRDIRELMTARNLHIVDVYDVDGKGKTRSTFGRVFYTEGRTLIFYAFDLKDRRITKANYSLQAWGYQQSTERSVQSLGIFYVDNQKQNRWALKFDNPSVLAQIDAVFVTIEPPGGSKRPSGDKLLYAYLKNQPNHP